MSFFFQKMLSAPSLSHKTHCQYCNAVCLVKNYKRHIKEVHSDKDPKDLKDNRSQSITSFFRSKRSSDLEDENISGNRSFAVPLSKRVCSNEIEDESIVDDPGPTADAPEISDNESV